MASETSSILGNAPVFLPGTFQIGGNAQLVQSGNALKIINAYERYVVDANGEGTWENYDVTIEKAGVMLGIDVYNNSELITKVQAVFNLVIGSVNNESQKIFQLDYTDNKTTVKVGNSLANLVVLEDKAVEPLSRSDAIEQFTSGVGVDDEVFRREYAREGNFTLHSATSYFCNHVLTLNRVRTTNLQVRVPDSPSLSVKSLDVTPQSAYGSARLWQSPSAAAKKFNFQLEEFKEDSEESMPLSPLKSEAESVPAPQPPKLMPLTDVPPMLESSVAAPPPALLQLTPTADEPIPAPLLLSRFSHAQIVQDVTALTWDVKALALSEFAAI